MHEALGPTSYTKQIRAVVAIELTILAIAFTIAVVFWRHVCDDTLESCLANGPVLKVVTFLVLATIRPFVFTPMLFVAIIAGKSFTAPSAIFLTALGSTGACLMIFGITKLLGRRLAKPWLRSNLPATFNFIRSQDYKVVFATRLIPIVPFDLLSFAFGALDFRFKSVAVATFIGVMPEAYVYASLVDPSAPLLKSTLHSLVVFGACMIVPLLIFEFLSRKKGSSLWQGLQAMYREIHYEVQINNDIVKRQQFDPNKTPVLLLYGFFSSRRALTVLERMLTARGHQVMSFNLGGLLGTFFTRDIIETASFIDYKIKRQIERHGFRKVRIVAHSKGGMVGLWWVLKLGGSAYCDTVITMGTPYRGTKLTYLALVTPLGLIWRDMGQMRPGSSFLRRLGETTVPNNVTVHCLHSLRDRVARGDAGVFQPLKGGDHVKPVPMHHISHFEFLYRKDVGETVSKILMQAAAAEPAAATQDVVSTA